MRSPGDQYPNGATNVPREVDKLPSPKSRDEAVPLKNVDAFIFYANTFNVNFPNHSLSGETKDQMFAQVEKV